MTIIRSFRSCCLLLISLVLLTFAGAAQAQTPTGDNVTGPYVIGRTVTDSRFTLARIQTGLEHIAAGRPALTLTDRDMPDVSRPLLEAYRQYLAGDSDGMRTSLRQVREAIASRLDHENATDWDRDIHKRLKDYIAELDSKADTQQNLIRLIVGLRATGAILLAESEASFSIYFRDRSTYPVIYSSVWLHLPCRTLVGRVEQVMAAEAALGGLAGELLSCPGRRQDYEHLAAIASGNMEPKTFIRPSLVRAPGRKRQSIPADGWDRETAVAYMAMDPERAAPILKAASTVDDLGRLDYMLFLYAFRPATLKRDATIATLMEEIKISIAAQPATWPPKPVWDFHYDETSGSLMEFMEFVSRTDMKGSRWGHYAIPCDVLLKRPKLLAVTQARYYDTMDNFIPGSGCRDGRGRITGFPDRDLEDFIDAAAKADGYFLGRYRGSLVHARSKELTYSIETMRINPRGLLRFRMPAMDYPYQTWGMAGLYNRSVATGLKRQYDEVFARIVAYNQGLGLTPDEAARAAKVGVFHVLWGSDCGGAKPEASLRADIMDGVPLADLRSRLRQGDAGEAQEVTACGRQYAGLAPLTHVAVVNPEVLTYLLNNGSDVDETNGFGKTPLMAAAQYNRLDAAQILLRRGAHVNATIWNGDLANDARSPLMYAAANSSLAMIKLLLDAGADPFQSDTKGARAIDYLLGAAPGLPPNPELSPQERSEAIRLLY